jgi:hypothetical protein
VKHKLIIGLIVITLATACRSVKTSVSRSSESHVSSMVDSSSRRETFEVDTVRIRIDTVTLFVPYETLIRDTVIMDPAPMVERSGRASVSVYRMPTGIRVTARCDSLELLLINKTVEILNLRKSISELKQQASQTEKAKVTRSLLPLWSIIIIIVSIALTVLLTSKKIKKFILP